MYYGSVCSGVESATLAWQPLGWKAAWFAETAPFPSAVLAQRWPQVRNMGDMRTLAERVRGGEIAAPDILVGGTPCQAFSVAGSRGGLADQRGSLSLEFVGILDAIDDIRRARREQPAIAVWENVPGVLSSRDNAFGRFLGRLCGLEGALQPSGGRWTNAGVVFGQRRNIAWRVLDAQYFGVAQRRERLFLVASAANTSPAEILFEREGVRRDFAPRGKTRQNLTDTPTNSTQGDCGEGVICMAHGQSNAEIRSDGGAPTLTCNHEAPIIIHGRQDPLPSDVAHPLSCQDSGMDNVICIRGNIIERSAKSGGNGLGVDAGIAATLTTADIHAVQYGTTVRRLTPLECERLQGMPDNHTRIAWRGRAEEDCPDGLRYKAIGNAMAVPVMRWIGRRIQERSLYYDNATA